MDGEDKIGFSYPAELVAAINAFRSDHGRARQLLVFPGRCIEWFKSRTTLSPKDATDVAALMAAADGDEAVDLEEEFKRPARVAAAVALLLRAEEWLEGQEQIRKRAQSIVDAAMAEIDDDIDGSPFTHRIAPSYLRFAAYYVAENWINSPSATTDEAVMRLLTSGDDHAVQVIVWLAYRSRGALGLRWKRLQYLALLWSGLAILMPRVTDEESVRPRWHRWRRMASLTDPF